MRSSASPVVLSACLFAGLLAGGLRQPLLWTAVAAAIWLAAFHSPRLPRPGFLGPWAAWLAWSFLSMGACDQPWKCLFSVARDATLVAFFCLAAVSWREEDGPRWVWLLCAASVALGLGTLFIKGTVHPRTGLIPPYYNYTVFVEAACAASALGAVGHAKRPRGWALAFLLGTAGFCLSMILLARSRSGLVAVAAAGVVWALRRGKIRPLLLAVAVSAGAWVLLPAPISSYLVKSDFSAWFTRPSIWRAALQTAGDHPLLGEGPGNFQQGSLRHNFPKHWATNYGFSADHAHSEVLEAAAETGWPGLALLAAAVALAWRRRRPAASAWHREAALAAWTAMTTQCLIDNMLHMPALGMLYFSSMVCAGAGRHDPSEPEGAPRPVWRRVCLAGFFLALSAWIPGWLVGRYTGLYETPGADPAWRAEVALSAARIFPADASLRENLARALLHTEPPQMERSLAELDRASLLNPTNALYPMLSAETVLAQGRPQEALRLADRAIELEPNYLAARLLRAELWARGGNKRAARRELREVERRRGALDGMPLYSGYDRVIVFFDPERFAAASLRAR
ncbi:MAG: O-antigen ligase family protein [Elusimicrobiota bacterium]